MIKFLRLKNFYEFEWEWGDGVQVFLPPLIMFIEDQYFSWDYKTDRFERDPRFDHMKINKNKYEVIEKDLIQETKIIFIAKKLLLE